MDIYNYNKSFFSYLLFQHFSFYWEMVETDREHGIIEGHVIKVPGWNWTHDKATFYICFQSSTSLFSCHCHLTSSEAVCLLTLALTPLTFVLSHRYSPSVQSYGLKAISQTSPTGPIRKPLWPHLGLTDYGGGVSSSTERLRFLSDKWHGVQRDAASAVDSPVSSVCPLIGRRPVRGGR